MVFIKVVLKSTYFSTINDGYTTFMKILPKDVKEVVQSLFYRI